MRSSVRSAALFLGTGLLLLAFIFPAQAKLAGKRVTNAVAQLLFGRPTTGVGAERQSSTIDLLEEVRKVQMKFQEHMNRHEVFPPDLVDSLEALMQPTMPYEVRGRAMRAGQVIGGKRFAKVLLVAMTDPNPAVRRTAVGKANDCPGLVPEMAPPTIAQDSDHGVRSAYEYWTMMHGIRVRNKETLRELPGAPGSELNPEK